MRHQNVSKGAKTIYASDAELWQAFIERAFTERVSVSSLLEKAMREYLSR